MSEQESQNTEPMTVMLSEVGFELTSIRGKRETRKKVIKFCVMNMMELLAEPPGFSVGLGILLSLSLSHTHTHIREIENLHKYPRILLSNS